MKHLRNLAAMSAAAVALAACTGGQATSPVAIGVPGGNVVAPSYSTLQFAAGTANIAGTIGLNTVVTFRQNNGLSAVGYSTPVITWDGNFTNTGATGNVDAGVKQISGAPLVVPGGPAAPKTTFGSGTASWGAFGYGFNPSNSSTSGGPNAIQYGCLPFYALPPALNLSAGTGNCAAGAQFAGGPPAFPQVRSAPLLGQLGAFLGFVPFAGVVAAPNPATGNATFTLNVTVPTAGGNQTATATSTMTAFAPLPTFATPVFTPLATGGGTIAYTLPAGVTEAYLIVINWGPAGDGTVANCNFGPGGPPYYYTVRVTPGSPNPVGLGYNGTTNANGDNLGATPVIGALPAGKSTKTFCSRADNAAAAAAAGTANPAAGDQFQVIGVGFDYPAYASAYPQSNGNKAPAIKNGNGQADLTVSDQSPVTPTGF